MKFIIITLALASLTLGCEISVKNVGENPFTFHIEYAGGNIHEADLVTGQHDNYECLCLPHDMKIIYQDIYCYHYMNCIDNGDYQVEVTNHAIYINVGNNNVETCLI